MAAHRETETETVVHRENVHRTETAAHKAIETVAHRETETEMVVHRETDRREASRMTEMAEKVISTITAAVTTSVVKMEIPAD